MFVDPLFPPLDEAKSGPESFNRDDTIPPSPEPDPEADPEEPSSDTSEVPELEDPEDPPKNEPLNEPNFCVIADILGVMTADTKL